VPITSMGALASAIIRHFAGSKPEEATSFTLSNPAAFSASRTWWHAAAETPAPTRLRSSVSLAIAADGVGNMTLQHGIGDVGSTPSTKRLPGRINAHRLSFAGRRISGKRRQTQAIADLAAKVIDQHRHVVAGKGLVNISAAARSNPHSQSAHGQVPRPSDCPKKWAVRRWRWQRTPWHRLCGVPRAEPTLAA